MKILPLISLASLALICGCQPQEPTIKQEAPQEQQQQQPVPQAPLPSPTASMVGVDATNQGYNLLQPWSKETARYSQGYAIYLGDGNFLTSANIVYSASFIELTSSDGAVTVPAVVRAFAPEANLALVRLKIPQDADFLTKLVPVKLGQAPKLGDRGNFWQFNDDGLPITTEGTLLATESEAPFANGEPFLLYNIKSSVTPLRGGGGNPVMVGDELVGLSMSCNTSAQKTLVATHTMLSGFLKQAMSGKYVGFPADGTEIAELTDPVFRKYLGLEERGNGVYIADLPSYGPFYKAGVRSGDVLMSINGIDVDSKGLIKDPALGPVSASVLLRESACPGDTVELGIRRKDDSGVSQPMTLKVTLDRSALDNDIIDQSPFIENPSYRIYGGLVFVPLTNALLEKVNNRALPPTIAEALANKDEFVKKGVDEIVLYMLAIPTQATLGYAEMAPSIVNKVNGVQVKNLKHLNQLLDQPAPNGIHCIEVSQQPYKHYKSTDDAKQADAFIQMRAIPVLRKD